jgi:glycosyltransferase involved in cell wall biosynthesis
LFKKLPVWLLSLLAYAMADRIVVTSQSDLDYIAKTYFLNLRRKTSVFSNYIDVDLFSPRAQGVPFNNRLLTVGRLVDQKNYTNLIKAAAKAKVGVDIVGKGPLENDLLALSNSLGADVRLLGPVPNAQLPQLMQHYSLFALLSFFEGNPKSLLEAMSCGLAIVGADAPGIREIIDSGKTGILVDPASPESIANTLSQIVRDQNLQQALGKAARKYIEKTCSLQAIAEREHALYESLL